jgi:hypothetical protein
MVQIDYRSGKYRCVHLIENPKKLHTQIYDIPLSPL